MLYAPSSEVDFTPPRVLLYAARVRMAQYLTLPLAITPRGAVRPALIEQEIDELALEDYKKDFINGQLLATRARPGRRVAGDAAEPFMVTRTGSRRRPTR